MGTTAQPPVSDGVTPRDPARDTTHAVVVMGIDPGTATTGYAFVRGVPGETSGQQALAYGVVETPAGDPMPVRLLALFRALQRLIAQHHPDVGAVERLFFGRNTTTAISVGQARGVALLAMAEGGLAVTEYTPIEVKQAMAGFGRAQKAQMQRMMQALLDLETLPHPDDAADALAVAMCHLRFAHLRQLGLRG